MKLLSIFVLTVCVFGGKGSLLGGLEGHHHHDHSHDHNHDHNHEHNHDPTGHHHDPMGEMGHNHPMGQNMTHGHDHSHEEEPREVSTTSTTTVATTTTTKQPFKKRPNRRKPKKFQNGRKGRKFRENNNRRSKNSNLNQLPFNFRIPRTGFSCKGRAPGYYADMEAECTVYHMCNARGGGRGFLCPQGTKFNQKTMVCDFAARVKCDQSSNFFHRNVIIHEASLAATKPRKQLRKLPRLTNSNIITIKRPETIRAKSNGRMGFAPLFEEERRQKMKMLKQVVKIMSDKKNNDRQTTSSTTTTTTTTTPRPTTRRPTTTTLTTSTTTTKPTTTTTSKPIQKSAAELLGLPELPPEPAVTPSPIFQIRIESPKSFQTSELSSKDYDYSDDLDYQDNPGRWQIIPPVEASKAIARHRVDPEQPILSLAPPPPAPPSAPSSSSSSNSVQNRPVSPFQIVGHVMSDEELKSFPDSPIVNISLSKGAKIEQTNSQKKVNILSSSRAEPKALKAGPVSASQHRHQPSQPFQSIKRTGKSGDAPSSISLPVQLGSPPGGNLPGPLVWISPASLARSPMVNLRTINPNGHHDRPPNVERALTMVFPARQRRRFEASCLACLSSGGLCPHCLVVKR